jgi:hypothetical protein
MEIYVKDEDMPIDCFNCPCFNSDINCTCNLNDGTKDYYNFLECGNTCPLKPLSQALEQERDRVCEEIEESINKLKELWCEENEMYKRNEYGTPDYILGSNFKSAFKLVKEKLDQIKGAKQ